MIRPYNLDQHGAIRGQAVAFKGNRARLRGRYLQDIVIPLRLGFQVFAGMNRVVVLAPCAIPVEKGLFGAFIHKAAGEDYDAVLIVNCHPTGLNDRLAGKIALRGHQRPSPVQRATVVRKSREREEEDRHADSGNCSG